MSIQTETLRTPKLRFPEFRGDWEEKKLGNIGIFKSGTGFTEAEQGGESGVPFLKVSDMNLKDNQKVMVEANNYVNDEQISRLNYHPINEQSIIFAKVGAAIFLERKRIANNFLIDNNMMAFIPAEGIDFIRQWFDTIRLSKYAQIGALPSYNAADLKTIKINLPTKLEQTKIANFLSSIDSKIEQLGKKQELLREYKKGLMQKIFSQAIRFKADDGSDYPDWEEKKLGDMLDLVVDNRGKTPPVIREKDIPLIEVNSIGGTNIDYKKVSKFVTSETFDNWFRKYLRNGDILFSTVGQTAVCSIYYDKVKSVIAQNIVGLRFFYENFKFMFYLLIDKKNNHKFKRIEMGAVQPSVKVSQMIHINFLIPALPEQTKIANFLSSIDSKIEQAVKQLDESKQFKKALLQQMFV
jgi:type I restriction enzyme S subunit